jgi:hypothetical protein
LSPNSIQDISEPDEIMPMVTDNPFFNNTSQLIVITAPLLIEDEYKKFKETDRQVYINFYRRRMLNNPRYGSLLEISVWIYP